MQPSSTENVVQLESENVFTSDTLISFRQPVQQDHLLHTQQATTQPHKDCYHVLLQATTVNKYTSLKQPFVSEIGLGSFPLDPQR